MWKFISQKKEAVLKKRLLQSFRHEIEMNLENYHVMDQLSCPKPFFVKAWQVLKDSPDIVLDPAVLAYGKALEDFNCAFEDFLKYQEWYSTDIDHKTQANARMLNDKKDHVNDLLRGLGPIIQLALNNFSQKVVFR